MDDLERRFVVWARDRPDVRAAVVVGSRARTDHPADEWSDLDIGLAVTHPDRYLSSTDWIKDIAPVLTLYRDSSGPTYHVLFEGALDVGVAIIPHVQVKLATRFVPVLRRLPFLYRLPGLGQLRAALTEAAEYYRRGGRIILDKDGVAQRFLALLPRLAPPDALPNPSQFTETVSEFWFAAVWTAKHLRRGELWWAMTEGCDGQMKSLLLRMIEWHAKAARGRDVDTWEGGRFLEEWADARVLERLPATFAHYGARDVEQALLATMDLFRWLATDIAERLGYPYPTASDEYVTKWVTDCLSGRDSGPRGGS
jgi:aminoglycoside 6-adenylyltransferase